MTVSRVILLVGILLHFANGFLGPRSFKRTSAALYSFAGRAAFLAENDDAIYIQTIKRRSLDATKAALQDGACLLEIEFPPLRSNDPSSAGTFDATVSFIRQYINDDLFRSMGRVLVVFPDRSERDIAKKAWGEVGAWCTLTSLDALLEEGKGKGDGDAASAYTSSINPPKAIIAVAPGFNIPEYDQISKLEGRWGSGGDDSSSGTVPIIVINGYLSRLRAGFYPALFYPGLARVTKSFYTRFVSVLHLSPVAVLGDRLGAWTVRAYPDNWEVLLKAPGQSYKYDVIESSVSEPEAKAAWRRATDEYKKRTGRMF
jgi:hypothetical protein